MIGRTCRRDNLFFIAGRVYEMRAFIQGNIGMLTLEALHPELALEKHDGIAAIIVQHQIIAAEPVLIFGTNPSRAFKAKRLQTTGSSVFILNAKAKDLELQHPYGADHG